MNKILIPTVLLATVMVAGMFALAPVEKASTVHTTIIAGTVGLACLTDTAVYSADQVDEDDLVLTFPNKAMEVLALRMNTDDADDDFGFDVDILVNGAVTQTSLLAQGAITEVQENTMDVLQPFGGSISVASGGNITLQFDTGTVMDNTDTLTIEVCGLVTDPANFVDADFVITAQNLAE